MNTEKPYLETKRVVIDRKYNPNYGDDRICQCGHTYYRHFDSYEDMEPVGCKYCQCYDFVQETDDDVLHIDHLILVLNTQTDNPKEEYLEYIKSHPMFDDRDKDGSDGEIYGDYIHLEDISIDFNQWLNSFTREGILFASIDHEMTLMTDMKGKKIRINKKLYTL